MQPGLFDEPRIAPATSPTQVRAERIRIAERQESGQKLAPDEVGKLNLTLAKGDSVTVAGREYRFHRDCGAFVWLAALDAGIAGPFYWHRTEDLSFSGLKEREVQFQPLNLRGERAAMVRAAQARLAACEPNGPEYMAALVELRAAMRGGERG